MNLIEQIQMEIDTLRKESDILWDEFRRVEKIYKEASNKWCDSDRVLEDKKRKLASLKELLKDEPQRVIDTITDYARTERQALIQEAAP